MAPSAVSMEREPAPLDLKDSKRVQAEQQQQQQKRVVHHVEGLTPLQAMSHGPIAIRGTPLSVFPILVSL